MPSATRAVPAVNDPRPLPATGWDRHWWDGGETFAGESPHFDLPAMAWIVARGVAILGGDIPSCDDPHPGQGQGGNRPLFASGALILAPLVNLGQVTGPRVQLVALPLKLRGACGAPCGAMVIES